VNSLPWAVDVSVTMPGGRTTRWSASLNTDMGWSASG
jgi:hypothetical protein